MRQFAAEMFAKFFEAGQNRRPVRAVRIEQFIGKKFEAQSFEQIQNALGGFFIQQSDVARINHVQRDADGDGFAVGNIEIAKSAPVCARPNGRNPAGARSRSQTGRRSWRCGPGAIRRSGGSGVSSHPAQTRQAFRRRARFRQKTSRRGCRQLSRLRRNRRVCRAAPAWRAG